MYEIHPVVHDLRKYCRISYRTAYPGLFKIAKLLILSTAVHCVIVVRISQAVEKLKQKNRVIAMPFLFMSYMLRYMSMYIHKVEISPRGEIGAGFYIGHPGNIYIGPSKIGRNFSVTHNVTIGLGLTGTAGAVPTIGDRVWIGTGSVIVGDITIGDGVTISAGSIVTRSIPAGCLVAGNPARVIARDYDNSHIIPYKMNDMSGPQTESQDRAVGCRPGGVNASASGCVADAQD